MTRAGAGLGRCAGGRPARGRRGGGRCAPVRRGELLALRWEDVDLDGRVLTVAGSVGRLEGVGVVRQHTTKGGGAWSLPLPQFELAADTASVEGVGAHTLRHSAAVAWLEAGVHII